MGQCYRAYEQHCIEMHGADAESYIQRLGIPKIDLKYLARILGQGRTIEQATRSEKRAASLGLHSFRHTVATAMDSRNPIATSQAASRT
jgi:hypothetical protein